MAATPNFDIVAYMLDCDTPDLESLPLLMQVVRQYVDFSSNFVVKEIRYSQDFLRCRILIWHYVDESNFRLEAGHIERFPDALAQHGITAHFKRFALIEADQLPLYNERTLDLPLQRLLPDDPQLVAILNGHDMYTIRDLLDAINSRELLATLEPISPFMAYVVATALYGFGLGFSEQL